MLLQSIENNDKQWLDNIENIFRFAFHKKMRRYKLIRRDFNVGVNEQNILKVKESDKTKNPRNSKKPYMHWFTLTNVQRFESTFPVDAGRKLNVHKTFRRRHGHLLNVLCTFNLRPVSAGLYDRKQGFSSNDFDFHEKIF